MSSIDNTWILCNISSVEFDKCADKCHNVHASQINCAVTCYFAMLLISLASTGMLSRHFGSFG